MNEHNLENSPDVPAMENIPALSRYKYPWWINLFVIGLTLAILYSLTLLPKYFVVAKKLEAAKLAYRNKNYEDSIELYRYVLKIVPSSKTARINAVEAIFSKNDKKYYADALSLLEGIKLNKDEWSRLKQVMPAEYQQYFGEVKK